MFKKIKYGFCRFMADYYWNLMKRYDSPKIKMRHTLWSVRAVNVLFYIPDSKE